MFIVVIRVVIVYRNVDNRMIFYSVRRKVVFFFLEFFKLVLLLRYIEFKGNFYVICFNVKELMVKVVFLFYKIEKIKNYCNKNNICF